MKAEILLIKANETMVQRGKDYDKTDGERSMSRTVKAFNLITGRDLTETEGWQFMEVLKAVRCFTGTSRHEDSLIDGIAYSSLKAESGLNENIKKAMK